MYHRRRRDKPGRCGAAARAVLVGCVLAGAGSCVRIVWAAPPTFDRRIEQAIRQVRFSVRSGRIQGTSDQFDRQQPATADGPDGRQQRIMVNLTTDLPSLDFQGTGPEGRLAILLAEGLSLRIEREELVGGGPPRRCELLQFPDQPLVFRWTEDSDGAIRERRAPGLWHLLLREPAATRERLLPILGALRPDWDLENTVQKIEEGLVRAASGGRIPDRRRWQALVAQLASENYSERRAADRALRLSGQAIVPFLDGLDPRQLDAEQRFRVRQIVMSLAGSQREDTPQSVASWLAVDPRAWLALLAREDAHLRRLAWDQLKRLEPDAGPFDPDAEPAIRAEQLTRLEERFSPPLAPATEAAEPPR